MKSKISSHTVLPGHNSVLCGSLSGLKIDLPQKSMRETNVYAWSLRDSERQLGVAGSFLPFQLAN